MPEPKPGTLRFLPEDVSLSVAPGETILRHAIRAGVPLLSPCGGEGRCGKCRVIISGEAAGGDDPGVLSEAELSAGVRLACRCHPSSGTLTVTVPPGSRPARLAAYLEGRDAAGDEPFLPLHAATGGRRPLGVALDLGTSTLAGALIDLSDGRLIARAAADNPQMPFGEDLISRIVYGEEHEGGFALLRQLLVAGVEQVIAALLGSGPAEGEIVEVTAAGNTVITHILFGASPAPIRHPPYQPVLREYPVRTGEELGSLAAPSAPWRLFPSLGGFVGGDIVAGVLASGMHREDRVCLLFDVGTNGEVALGNREFLMVCSSSAGPAFEGGEVACGMRAYPGAIESVRIDPETLSAEWTVIGGGKPLGICGSGILDLCAEMFRTGLIDRAGQFVPRSGAPFAETARGRAFVVAGAERSATGSAICFAAPDLKSVLRTKAALCAAADSLLAAVGLPRDAVERVYIAGGFGNFLDLRSALSLGVFPPFPLETYVPLGNASLAGAIGAIRSRRRWREALSIAAGTTYHDLSSDAGFMEAFQRALFIPHTDEESYRKVLASRGGR
jgi:uncharacterized 2Fe-2S/4Fe-4S cluster protein (DUF4445 family)